MLCGDKGLDERISALRVKRQGVMQRGQLWALLYEALLQAVPSSMKVLLQDTRAEAVVQPALVYLDQHCQTQFL